MLQLSKVTLQQMKRHLFQVKDNNGNIVETYNPDEPQWWITSFNSYQNYKNMRPEELQASFTVDFTGKEDIFDLFSNK